MASLSIRSYNGITPTLASRCYVDPTAVIIGDVTLSNDTSVWPYAVIRGDVNAISVGAGSNIQDFSMLHVSHKHKDDPTGAPLSIGCNVTIGHHVTLHGCTIADEVLIGIGSIVLDKVVIEKHVLVGAGSLVPPGKHLKSGYLYLGNPVKQIRPLTEKELAYFLYSAEHYQRLAQQHALSLG